MMTSGSLKRLPGKEKTHKHKQFERFIGIRLEIILVTSGISFKEGALEVRAAPLQNSAAPKVFKSKTKNGTKSPNP